VPVGFSENRRDIVTAAGSIVADQALFALDKRGRQILIDSCMRAVALSTGVGIPVAGFKVWIIKG
jgi:hypothetical protein